MLQLAILLCIPMVPDKIFCYQMGHLLLAARLYYKTVLGSLAIEAVSMSHDRVILANSPAVHLVSSTRNPYSLYLRQTIPRDQHVLQSVLCKPNFSTYMIIHWRPFFGPKVTTLNENSYIRRMATKRKARSRRSLSNSRISLTLQKVPTLVPRFWQLDSIRGPALISLDSPTIADEKPLKNELKPTQPRAFCAPQNIMCLCACGVQRVSNDEPPR